MLPLHFSGLADVALTVVIGFWFGFVLEQAGFGDCRNLAAQFYLSSFRVLKVMFTAIVTAMVLIFAGSAIGLIDFDRIFVPPTYLGSSILGGFALGTGFIIGGYCPGTSLVSAATLKLDGIAFALGVTAGLFVFGLMSPLLEDFWISAGALGRLTLFEWLGVDAGVVVLAVFGMAIGAFAFGEWAERRFVWAKPPAADRPNAPRLLRAVAIGGFVLAFVTLVMGQPDATRKIAWQHERLNELLRTRKVFIDPAELLDLLYNNQVDRVLLDVRSEMDYNTFHIKDAVRTTVEEIDRVWRKSLRPEQIVVVMSNDERQAIEAWKHLAVAGAINAYILAGGVNRWCDIYYAGNLNVPGPEFPAGGDDRFRYGEVLSQLQACPASATPVTLKVTGVPGDRIDLARPDRKLLTVRKFTRKVVLLKATKAPGGGCGG